MSNYNVKTFRLDVARNEPGQEIKVAGTSIYAYTDANLEGVFVRLDEPSADPIKLSEFSGIHVAFKRIYLQTPIRQGKYLRLFVGKSSPEFEFPYVTVNNPIPKIHTIIVSGESYFTEALNAEEMETEYITGLLSTRVRITDISIQSAQNLHYRLMLWAGLYYTGSFNTDFFAGSVDLDLSSYGFQIGGAGNYFYSTHNIDINFSSIGSNYYIFAGLLNQDVLTKNAGETGRVDIFLTHEPL